MDVYIVAIPVIILLLKIILIEVDIKNRILVIDADESLLEEIKRMLTPNNEILSFYTVKSFFEKYCESNADLFIINLSLNNRESIFELIQQIRGCKRYKKTAIFILFEGLCTIGWHLEATLYLSLPLKEEEFKLEVIKYTSNKQFNLTLASIN